MATTTQSTTHTTVKPGELAQIMRICLDADQPLVVWSSPGIGKTSIARQTTQAWNAQAGFIQMILSQKQEVDLIGVPRTDNGFTVWCPPSDLPTEQAVQAGTLPPVGVLFLDELNRAQLPVQNAALQLVNERQVGQTKLAPGWRILAACNYGTSGGTQKTIEALSSRFSHCDLIVDLDDWCKWAVTLGKIHPAVIACVRLNPRLLDGYALNERSFSCPRTIEFCSKIYSANGNLPKSLRMKLIAGTVGHGAAVELEAMYDMYRLIPSLDSIRLSPSTIQVPGDPSLLYALTAAMGRMTTDSDFERFLTYAERLPVEYCTLFVRDAVRRVPAIGTNPGFTRWAIQNQDVLI